MVKIGQVAMKIAGRDAGKLCVVVDVLDNNYVIVDGNTRRKKCNPRHLEFLNSEVKIKKNADTEEVMKALNTLGFKADKAIKNKEEKPKKISKKEVKIKQNKEK